jgi:hypothetical protein
MRKNSKNKNRPVNRWNDADRRAFADGNRLRAQTIQGKRFGGAEVDEWDWVRWSLYGGSPRATPPLRLRRALGRTGKTEKKIAKQVAKTRGCAIIEVSG